MPFTREQLLANLAPGSKVQRSMRVVPESQEPENTPLVVPFHMSHSCLHTAASLSVERICLVTGKLEKSPVGVAIIHTRSSSASDSDSDSTSTTVPTLEICDVPHATAKPPRKLNVTRAKQRASAEFDRLKSMQAFGMISESPSPEESILPVKIRKRRDRMQYKKKKKNKTSSNSRSMAFYRTSAVAQRQVVQTPSDLLAKLDALFHFDHDPCPVLPTRDAMKCEWGRMNFVNPPFSNTAGFVARAVEMARDHGKCSVVLCIATTGSLWFRHAFDSGCLAAVVALRGGLKFIGYKEKCPYDLMLLLLRPPHADGSKEQRIPLLTLDPCHKTKRRIVPVEVETLHSESLKCIHWPGHR